MDAVATIDLADDLGRVVRLPKVTVAHLVQAGERRLRLELAPPAELPAQPADGLTFTWLADRATGIVAALPTAMVAVLRDDPVVVELDLPIAADPATCWPRIKDVAEQLADDLPGLSYNASRARIVRAIAQGHLESVRTPDGPRLSPTTVDAWRLRQRDIELDRAEGA